MKPRRKQRQARTHSIQWILIVLAAIIALCAVMGVRGVMAAIEGWEQNLPSVTNTDAFKYSAKTHIYANDRSTLLAEFYLQDQEPVSIGQVSKLVLNGTVATEDVRFYEHDGVDLAGIARALVNNFLGGELEGASTITQQLVRNTLLSDEANDISIKRKIREATLAMEMEKQYSKEDILLMYLNTINYGNGHYGIQAASQYYFQKNASDLSVAEAATLIGIPQSPTFNNPVDYPDNCLKRRNLVLDRMLSYGAITQEEYEAARNSQLSLNVAPARNADGIFAFPYFTSYVRQTLLEKLSYEQVFDGGLTVYTTIDPQMQAWAEESADQVYHSMTDDALLSMTCVDPKTGYILAMIGGRDYAESEFNLATSETGRQAGSSFKAFTLAAAIEQGINPKSTVDCKARDVIDGWSVSNYGGSDYGVRSIESATWVSSNTGFAHLVTDPNGVTPASVLEMANRLGVSGSANNGFGAYPALTLGVAQVNTLMMAGAYGAFANNGLYNAPVCITTCFDQNGTILIDNTNPQGVQALTPEVAGAVTDVLKGVVTSGTARDTILSNQVSAGKTGTSENWRDLWFCGYTPQLSCAVWTGTDSERSIGAQSWSRSMWRIFMTKALQNYQKEDFAKHDKPKYTSEYNKKHPEYVEPVENNENNGNTAASNQSANGNGQGNGQGQTQQQGEAQAA